MKQITAICIACLMVVSASAPAVGPSYMVGEIKEVSCVPPVTREDGSPIALDEIQHMEIYITQDAINKGEVYISDLYCTLSVDTSEMTPGQWFVIGVTVDTGGQKSVDSDPVPFTLTVQLARPLPPTMRIN